jgi:hypothetical protein
MVGGRLLFTSNYGDIAFVDPVAGALKSTGKLAGPADMPPIAAAGLLVQLTRDATLTAYG